MPRSIDRLYSEGVMKKRFLNAALKVRIVENPACPAISVMLRVDCFSHILLVMGLDIQHHSAHGIKIRMAFRRGCTAMNRFRCQRIHGIL